MSKINKETRQTLVDVIEFMTKFIVHILKWCCLLAAVTFGGLTIGYLIIAVIRNVDLANTMIAKMTSYITFYNYDEAIMYINSRGAANVIVASLAYGFAHSLTYAIMYYILDKYLGLFKKIKNTKVFTKENLDTVRNCVYLSLVCSIVNPLIITVAFLSTQMLGTDHINFNGLFYVIISYTIFLIYKEGYKLEKENIDLKKSLSDKTIKETDKKIEKVKKETKAKKTTKK